MRGILFKKDLFDATISGQKDVTRRDHNLKEINANPDWWEVLSQEQIPYTGIYTAYFLNQYATIRTVRSVKARFKVGEVLYLCEPIWVNKVYPKAQSMTYFSYDFPHVDMKVDLKGKPWKSVSPMFFPQVYARYFIKIKSIRLERIQQINCQEAMREGMRLNVASKEGSKPSDYIKAFRKKWDEINGAASWEKNIYVWRYEYEYLKDKERRF